MDFVENREHFWCQKERTGDFGHARRKTEKGSGVQRPAAPTGLSLRRSDGSRSAAWDVAPRGPPLPTAVEGSEARERHLEGVSPGAGTRPGSRSDISSTA